MDLMIIIGSGAVGKMTIGQELTKITDFKLFHNHMIIEPLLEIFGGFQGSLIEKIRNDIFDEFIKTEYQGLIFTYMMAFDLPSNWEYIRNLSAKFEATGGTVYYVELVADQEVRLRRNRTDNRLKNKPSKRNLNISDDRLIYEDKHYRLESFEGEIPFDNYIRIDNTFLEPSVVASLVKDHFHLSDKSVKETFSRIKLQEVTKEELFDLYKMQEESFMPLYKKYHDESFSANETIERFRKENKAENNTNYFIVMDGARVGGINLGQIDSKGKRVSVINSLFVLPKFQNQGIGYVAIQKAFEILPQVTIWKLSAISQEPGNCRLFEKCGFVRFGKEKTVNNKMSLVEYQLKKERQFSVPPSSKH